MSWGRFDTRTIVLIPIAIAINIVLGQTVGTALKVPIYLDSIGTILVGVLAGPIPGLVTGSAGQPDLDLRAARAVPFRLRRALRGRRRGDRVPVRRVRPDRLVPQPAEHRPDPARSSAPSSSWSSWLAIGYYGFLPFYTDGTFTFFGDTSAAGPFFTIVGYLIAIGIVGAIVGLVALLLVRRDLGVAYVAIGGLLVRDPVRDHLGADLRRRLRRGDRFRDGLPRRRLPAGRFGPPDGGPAAGPAVRPDRQDDRVLHRVRDPPDAVPPLRIALPAGREGGRPGAGVALSTSAGIILADDLDPADVERITRLVPPTPSPYHRLNPLTKAVMATVGSIGAFAAGGYIGPIAIDVVMVLLAWRAGVLGQLARVSALLTLPIAISVVLVSVFTRAGTTVLFEVGPFDATAEGVDFAAQTLVRLFAISLSIGLFVLTTNPRAFVFDLERRGVSPRIAFVAVATIEAVPALVERAGVIGESQRARGLDTEGSIRARLRGILPLVGPVIIGALTDVEERSLALESRAFCRPGRRHLLWAMSDQPWERWLRWALVVLLVATAVARLTGRI